MVVVGQLVHRMAGVDKDPQALGLVELYLDIGMEVVLQEAVEHREVAALVVVEHIVQTRIVAQSTEVHLCSSGEGRAVQSEGDSWHIHRSRDFVGIALVLERSVQQVVDIVLDKPAEVVAVGRRVVVPEVLA